jgi:hypothetical protein
MLAVIVNNSTNINQTNNPLSPQTTGEKKKEHMALEIQLLAWDRNTNEAGLTQIMGSQPPSNNWTPNDNTDIN